MIRNKVTMSFDPGEGTSDGRFKRATIFNTEIAVKQEIKDEPADGIELDSIPNDSAAGHNDVNRMIKSEIDSDSETDFDFVLESDGVKEEMDTTKPKMEKKQNVDSEKSSNIGGDGKPDNNSKGQSNSTKQPSKSKPNEKKLDGLKKKQNASRTQLNGKQKVHKCSLCKYESPIKYNLNRHMRTHSEEKPFHCSICFKKFAFKHDLNRHMKVHAKFKCPICYRVFSQENKMIDHLKMCFHRQYECFMCKHRTPTKMNLMKHMRTHSGEKPFKCSVCNKSFAQKINLNRHLNTHRDELTFCCVKCDQSFSAEESKVQHEKKCYLRHYECYLCRYKNYMKPRLEAHMKFKHTGEKPFSCKLCMSQYSSKTAAKFHMKYFHR